jgi:hypothetical protein
MATARRAIVLAFVGLSCLSAEARAQPAAAPNDVAERLAFLEDRIDTQRAHATLWWGGWLAFYSLGGVVQAGRATLETDRAVEADLWVSVVKAAGGVARFWAQPHGGIRGLEPAPRQASFATQTQRLARAEAILEHNARRTHAFGRWYGHVLNVVVNGLGAVIVGVGFDDWETGLISGGIGVAVGEASFFTGPWEADDDLEEYRQRFGPTGSGRGPRARGTPLRWSVLPTGGGAALRIEF